MCVGEAADGAEALDLIRKVSPELLFLDVRMPGLTGLEVLRRSATSVPVIFTTAYDDYAFVAFELGAIDYLRKPFGAARLSRALERARPHLEAARTRSSSAAGASLDERLAFAENVPSPLDRLFVRHGGEVIPVRLTDVSRFEATGYCPCGGCGFSFCTRGSSDVFHPPPSAFTSDTLAVIRRPAICTATRWSLRAILCAVITSR